MQNHISIKPFLFNPEIDVSFLADLYSNDYLHIEDVFATTLEELSEQLPMMESAFQSGDLVNLKKTAHRIKPSFGFTGLLKTQNKLQEFEDLCLEYDSTAAIAALYSKVFAQIENAVAIIKTDYERLKMYNRS